MMPDVPAKRRRPPTLVHVAEAAGVSPSTVSAVLNNMPRAKNYAAATKERIRAAAAALGYVPNPLARTLKQTKSRTIGFVMLSRHSHYYDQLLQGAESYVRESGYELVTGDMGFQPQQLERCIQQMLAWRVEGLFLMTGGNPIAPHIILALNAMGIPYIKGGVRQPNDPCVCVDFDNHQAGVLLAEHLVALGHRHFGVLAAGSQNHQANERIRGVGKVLSRRRIPLSSAQVVRAASADVGLMAGCQYAAQLIEQQPATTVIVCTNDLMAIGAMKCLRQSGRSVPDDVSITGFDDLCIEGAGNSENRLGAFVTPTLTTIRTPLYAIGRATMEMLVDMIRRPEHLSAAKVLTFPPELIVRQSTGPAPGRHCRRESR